MHFIKTTFVTLGVGTTLFLVWITVTVFSGWAVNHTRMFGRGLLIAPIVSVWFWIAVLVAAGLYFRLSR